MVTGFGAVEIDEHRCALLFAGPFACLDDDAFAARRLEVDRHPFPEFSSVSSVP